MAIADLMQHRTIAVLPDSSVREAAERMRRSSAGCLVVTDGNRPIGMLTDRDLASRVVAQGRDAGTTTVRDVMTDRVATIHTEHGVLEALELMASLGVRRLPVVDGDGMLAGIVTLDDFIRLLAGELGSVGQVLLAQSLFADDADDA